MTNLKSFLLFVLFGFLVHLGKATNYYISPDGNSQNSGTSPNEAFASFQTPIINNLLVAGDTVFVLDGSYAGFTANSSLGMPNGTTNAPIVFKALGENVHITSPNATDEGIRIAEVSHIVIDGFHISGMSGNGISILNSSYISILNNICENNNRNNIMAGCSSNLTILNNQCDFSLTRNGINLGNSGDNHWIEGNTCRFNAGSGIQLNGDTNIFCPNLISDGIMEGVVLNGNILHENGQTGGAAINLDGAVGVKVTNNLLTNNHASGITLYRHDASQASDNAFVAHNTIIQASDSRWGVLVQAANVRLFNNFVFNPHPLKGSLGVESFARASLQSDFNILDNPIGINGDDVNAVLTLADWQTLGKDINSELPDDLEEVFVSPENRDFHPLENGQLVDKGSVLPEVTSDLEKNLRPVGASSDIGAYEMELDAAQELTYGDCIFDTIEELNGADVHTFNGNEGDIIELVGASPTPFFTICIELRNDVGEVLRSNCSSNEAAFTFTIPENGLYHIIVTELFGDVSGDYYLSLHQLINADNITLVNDNGTFSETINCFTDKVGYKVGLEQGTVFRVRMNSPTPFFTSCIYLYDFMGELIASNCSSNQAEIETTVPATGCYYIWGNELFSDVIGDFNITFTTIIGGYNNFCGFNEICNNGIDDDQDGLIDCEDTDCAEFIDCVEVECVNTQANISILTTGYCDGETLSLSVNEAVDYQWSGPNNFTSSLQNPQIPNLNTTNSGIYFVTITDSETCQASDQITITISPTPTALASNTGPYSTGANIHLNANGGSSYQWTGPNNFSSNEQNPIIPNATVAQAGTYTVVVTNTQGCSNSALTEVLVSDNPSIDDVIFAFGEAKGNPGDTILLPITLTNCPNFAAFQTQLQLQNPETADFIGLQDALLTDVHFNLNNNILNFLGEQTTGVFTGNQDTLFYLIFVITGEAGQTSIVTVDESYPTEVACFENGQIVPVEYILETGLIEILNTITITGDLRTYKNDPIGSAEVQLIINGQIVQTYTTGADGTFTFEEVELGQPITIRPTKNINPLNGISITELAIFREFILNNNPEAITSNYQVLAGNSNCDMNAGMVDLAICRQALLGHIDNFMPECESWVFVNSANGLPEELSTFIPEFESEMVLENPTGDVNINFIGVKICDVLGDADPENLEQELIDERSYKTLNVVATDMDMAAGETRTIPFTVRNFNDVKALQMALLFDTDYLELVSFEKSEHPSLKNLEAGLKQAEDGEMRLVWWSEEEENLSLKEGTVLFNLTIRVKQSISNISNYINVNSEILSEDVLVGGGKRWSVKLGFEENNFTHSKNSEQYFLHSIFPNPSNGFTIIPFYLPENTLAKGLITNQLGQVVFQMEKDFSKGENKIEVELEQDGIYYYTLLTENFNQTKSFVVKK